MGCHDQSLVGIEVDVEHFDDFLHVLGLLVVLEEEVHAVF